MKFRWLLLVLFLIVTALGVSYSPALAQSDDTRSEAFDAGYELGQAIGQLCAVLCFCVFLPGLGLFAFQRFRRSQQAPPQY